MQYHVYMLRLENDQIYVGSTDDLQRRYHEHLSGSGSKTTRDSKPVAIIFSEPHPDRPSAILRERQFKKWSHAKKLALAEGKLDHLHKLSKGKS